MAMQPAMQPVVSALGLSMALFLFGSPAVLGSAGPLPAAADLATPATPATDSKFIEAPSAMSKYRTVERYLRLVESSGPANDSGPGDASASGRTFDPADGHVERVPYTPPVDREVVGGFHLEFGQYGAGRRGIEYDTTQGDIVRATAAGIVTFAGEVAGRVSMTISHADGRRSTVTSLIEVRVRKGQIVLGREVIGLAAPGLLLTLREGDVYVDPAPFLQVRNSRASLVPTRALGPAGGPYYTLPSARSEDQAPSRIIRGRPVSKAVATWR
ncbi:MAG TPA: M23 family metallopeptidase [Microthrixaceae bacterium]|nr:M23 family metallopeptidase [Microthrixaceae bacterium]